MRKILLTTLASASFLTSFAEGYQVNLQSAKQAGMGHVGVAMKLGAESMHFNPAGMGFMDKRFDLSLGASGIMTEATYTHGDYHHVTDNEISTPLFAYGALSITDKFKIGASFTTPYGSSLNWGKEWAGSTHVQHISLQAFSFQPTIAFQITDRLSIGAGAMIQWGNVNLSRSLMPAGTLNSAAALLPLITNPEHQAFIKETVDTYKDKEILSATLEGKAQVGVGFNVGLMWEINDQWTLGASYRSQVDMKVTDGKTTLNYADQSRLEQTLAIINPILQAVQSKPIAIPPLDKGTFAAELPLPTNITAGISYRPNKRLEFGLDVQFVQWSAYESLDIHFSEEVMGGYSLITEKNSHDAFAVRFGANYTLSKRWDIRGGIYYDATPLDASYYTPETPGMDKIGSSIGLSYRPAKNLSIDLSALYIAGLAQEGASTTIPTGSSEPVTFSGTYETTAFAPSIGVSYAF